MFQSANKAVIYINGANAIDGKISRITFQSANKAVIYINTSHHHPRRWNCGRFQSANKAVIYINGPQPPRLTPQPPPPVSIRQ